MNGLPDDLNGLIEDQCSFRVRRVVRIEKGFDAALAAVDVQTNFFFALLPAKQHQGIVNRDACQPGRKFGFLVERPQS